MSDPTIRMVVHLVNGTSVTSSWAPVTAAELAQFKEGTGDMLGSSGGWQFTLDLPGGGWACFPKQSVLYVEIIHQEENPA